MDSEPTRKPSQPVPGEQSEALTDPQRAFAEVVGRALADTWRRRCQNAAGEPHVARQQDACSSARAD